ncbi:MAG: restriction endonuclease subunit S [Paeniclostridium sordellii]|nr:restriction endonuclease subunit S [Paeniclostridium sordellii]
MEYIKCIDIIDVRDGTHDSPKYINDGGYPLITSKNIKNNIIDFENVNYISYEDYIKINKRSSVCNGDIIMPMIGTIGNPVLVNTDIKFAIKNVALFKLSNNNNIDSKFFYYCLKSDKVINQLSKNKRGGTQSFVSLTNLRELKIPNICIRKQKKIVEVLDKAQELIDKRKEQIEDLDELVKSRFIEIFGSPFDTTKWVLKKLKEVSISISDGSNVDKKYYQECGEVLFLRIQNVWCNELRLEDSVYISENINQDYIDTSLCTGDLLITKIGRFYTKDSSLGRVALYLGENDKANYSNNIMRVRLKDEVLSEYVNALLNLDDYNQYIRRVSVGGTDKRALSKTLIGDFPIIVPPMELQKSFIDFIKQVDKLKFEMENSLKELEDNFNSLMQKAFRGELF